MSPVINKYRDPIIAKLITILKAEGPSELKNNYFYGNPYILPQNQNILPACFISQVTDSAQAHSTSEDQSVKRYQINISVEMKRDWSRSSDAVETHMRLQRYISGMDDSFNWLTDSIMYILRKYEVLDGANKLYIDLGSTTVATIQPGIEARGVGIFTYEGTIEFNVRHTQIRPSLG